MTRLPVGPDIPHRKVTPWRWTPVSRITVIAWTWGVLAAWSIYWARVQQWAAEAHLARPKPPSGELLEFLDLSYSAPMVASIVALGLAVGFIPLLSLATWLALLKRPLALCLVTLVDALALACVAVALVAFGGSYLVWVLAFIVAATFVAHLSVVISRPALSTQPN